MSSGPKSGGPMPSAPKAGDAKPGSPDPGDAMTGDPMPVAAKPGAAGSAGRRSRATHPARPEQGSDAPGFELPLRLLMAFRVMIDEMHEELARQGHPGMRPMHGFVFQAIGPRGTTAADLGRVLGVSKQAAGKTIDGLERLGYVERGVDPADARRKVVRLTAHGFDSLARTAAIFDDMRARWADILGEDRLRALEADLRTMTPGGAFHIDMPAWFGGG